MSRPTLLVPLLAAMALAAALAAKAQERTETADQLRFHRVYAPADRMSDWPTGEGKYLPLTTAEFERLLALARSGASDKPGPFTARIAAAEYRAKFEGEQLLNGRATLVIIHYGQTATMLPIEPCNVAIRSGQSPILGIGRSGKLQMLVEQSGKMLFDWSLAGRPDVGESLLFFCEFPACPTSVFWLDLPEKLIPAVDKGLISLAEEPVDGHRRWRIDLGGNSSFQLRLAVPGKANVRPPFALLSESNVYELSPRGLDLSAQWKIQAQDKPLDKIIVLLDPGIQLATARLGDVSLSWTIEPLRGDAGTRAAFSLPEPIQDTDRILRLGAMAPLTLDRPWRLPRLQPEGLFWQEGRSTLIVPDSLVVQRLVPINCSQTAVAPLSEPRVGESVEFQNFSPDAAVEVSLARRHPAVRLTTGTAVELGSGQMTARIVADLRSDAAQQFALEANVSKSWIIDSVEATPAEIMADWSLEGQSSNQRKLLIHLSKGPSPTQPIRLVINGRRLRTFLTHQWNIGDLLPLRFTTPLEDKRLAAIQAADPYELNLNNDEQITRRNTTDLTPAEMELFAAPPKGLLFEDDAGAAALEIALQARKPTFTGDVLVEASINKNRLQETYSLRCTPESAGINRVIVELSQPSDVPPEWTLVDEDKQPLSVRQWSKNERTAAGLSATGETWELTLPEPHSDPFEIRGMREVDFNGSQAVCLASLPEADDQRGALLIRALGGEELHFDNRRLKSIPPEPVAPDQFSTVRGAFRFDPVHDVSLATDPALIVSAASKEKLPPIWVLNYHLESWYENQGSARHLASYEVQNTGVNEMQIVLPPGVTTADIRGVWVDRAPVDWQKELDRARNAAADPKENIISAPLPATKRFSTVSIYFITHESGLRTIGSLAPPLPEVKPPVLAGAWTVWLPPGFEVVGVDPNRRTWRHAEFSFSRRLFGPFGRDSGQESFNPFVGGDWMPLAGDRTESKVAEIKSPPISSNPPGCQPADTQGWTALRLELSGAGPIVVSYVHRGSQQCWAALIFLLTLGLSYWKAAKYPIFFTILTGIFGILAFVLPETFVPLASAAVLGMLGCLLLIVVRIRQKTAASAVRPDRESPNPSPQSISKIVPSADRAGMILLLAFACFCIVGKVRAEETAEKAKSAASAAFRVFIPIDSDKKPVGDKIYLPEKLFDELYRRAALATEEPQGWLLGSAVYRGSLVHEAATGRLASDAIKAQFDLNVFGRMVEVKIPFHRENAQLIPDSAALDGRPITPEWETDGSALKFEVEAAGKYRLELGFRPASRGAGTSAGFEMSIPRLPQSRLELTLPAEVPGIEAQSAIGAVHAETDPSRFVAELGPANRLAVHWPASPASEATGPAVDADQLTWLKVQSGSVVVDVRFKFHLSEAQLRRLQLATDPRLRLLPLQGKDAPSVQIRSDNAKRQIITLQWNRPLAEEATLDLSFLMTGASGVGKFRLPQIDLLDMHAAKRWLAISVDPILQYESQRTSDLEAAPPADFLKNWGPASSPPVQAYRLENDKTDWTLSTRPREPEISARQLLALSYGETNVDAYFDAQLSIVSGNVFQYQLFAPAAMKVLQASVRKEGVQQAARWSQEPGGTITIFLTGPADGNQEISLHGIMSLEGAEKTPLPSIGLMQCRLQSTTVQVFRRPEVNLELILPDNIQLLSSDSPLPLGVDQGEGKKSPLPTNLRSVPGEDQGEGVIERGRLLKTFRVEGGEPVQGEVHVTANRPDIDAKQVTRMRQDVGKWTAQADFQLRVTKGIVDQFWIDAPNSWREPYLVDPPAAVKAVEITGDTRRLIVQPQSAVRGEYAFSISGTLEIEPGETLDAPEIILRKAQRYSRWLTLPKRLKDRPIAWETRGLRPAELPASLTTPSDGESNFSCEIIGEAPQAVIRAHNVPAGSAKVRLADIQMAWQSDGFCRGAAVYDLEPGGQQFCPLNLPQGYELVHASIDGQLAAPLSLGKEKWKLPLVSDRLPQRIEVVFRGELLNYRGDGPQEFDAPSLGDLPVSQTLWTVAGPVSHLPETGKVEKSATLAHQQWIRYRSAAAIITAAENLLQSDDADEMLRWYRNNSRYLMVARSSLQNELNLNPDSESSRTLRKDIEKVDGDQAELAERIGMTKVLTQAKAETPATNKPAEYRRQQFGDYPDYRVNENGTVPFSARYAFEGSAPSITIEFQPIEHIGLGRRIVASLYLAGAVFVFILGIRRGTWTDLLKNRPHAAGIAAGLAWWYWLWPSVLGAIIMIVCLATWCRTLLKKLGYQPLNG